MASERRVAPQFSPSLVGGLRLGVVVVIVVAIGLILNAALRLQRPTAVVPPALPRIELTSQPYPLTVGNNTLHVRLLDAEGNAAQATGVRVDAASAMPGTLPVSRLASTVDGGFSAMLTLSMTGQWRVDVLAELPDGDVISEQFDVFVYPVPPENTNARTTFVSASELEALPHDPERELRVIIPQGTRAGIVGGHGEDVIGDELRLSVSGRNTLVIRNDDIADHNVGPFFVRAGETLRQEFRRPAEYVGACSIRHGATVSIIVDA